MAALSSLLDAEEGLLCRSILRGLLTAAARRGSTGAGLLLPTDLMCLHPHMPVRVSVDDEQLAEMVDDNSLTHPTDAQGTTTEEAASPTVSLN